MRGCPDTMDYGFRVNNVKIKGHSLKKIISPKQICPINCRGYRWYSVWNNKRDEDSKESRIDELLNLE